MEKIQNFSDAYKSMSIIFLGDLMPGRYIQRKRAVEQDVLDYIQTGDIRVCNLEGVVTDLCPDISTVQRSPSDHVCKHGADIIQAQLLNDIGINCCNIANNHILDFGYKGVKDTLHFLNDNNIKWFGFGRNYSVAWKPRMYTLRLKPPIGNKEGDCNSTEKDSIDSKIRHDSVESTKVKIAFFGLADHFVEWKAYDEQAGINYFDVKNFTYCDEGNPNHSLWTNFLNIKEHIDKVRKKADLIVFSIHWGDNFQDRVCSSFQEFAHCLIDAGVNIIHAHSPHHIQGIQIYHAGFIMYGCGEFLNDYDLLEDALESHGESLGQEYVRYYSHLSFVYKLHLISSPTQKLRLDFLEMLPIVIKAGKVSCCEEEDKQILFSNMKKKCEEFKTNAVEKNGKLYINICQ